MGCARDDEGVLGARDAGGGGYGVLLGVLVRGGAGGATEGTECLQG